MEAGEDARSRSGGGARAGPRAAIDAAPGLTRIGRRGSRLTPFGGHFCEYCLPLGTVEIETLPAT